MLVKQLFRFVSSRCIITAASNKSMDVRAKQRLSYRGVLFPQTCLVAGFAPRHLNRWAVLLYKLTKQSDEDIIMTSQFYFYLTRTTFGILFVLLLPSQFTIPIKAQSVEASEIKVQENLEEAPQVVFRVSAHLQNSDLFGDPVVANFPTTVGNNFPYNLMSDQGVRKAHTSGTVSSQSNTGTVTGDFSTEVTGTNSVNPFWRGISKRTMIEAFVRGSSPTLFNLRFRTIGNILAQASNQNGGRVDAYINGVVINSTNNPNTRDYDDTVEITDGSATSCGYTFPEYPNVSYCLASNNLTTSGLLALNGAPVTTDLFGRTNGSFQLTVTRLEPKISVEPILVDFDAIRLNQSARKSFIVRNIGTGTLNVNLTQLFSPFSIIGVQRSFSILAGQSKTVEIEYRPTAVRMNKMDIVVSSNDTTSTPRVIMQGATAAKFKFWLRAFIPRDIPGYTIIIPNPPAPQSNMTGIPDPYVFPVTRVAYLTDQRSFSSSEQASARIALNGEYEVQGYGRFVKVSQELKQGETIRCDLGIPGLSSPFCLERSGKPRGSFSDTGSSSETLFPLEFFIKGGNPFIPRSANAWIDVNGRVTVNFANGQINMSGLIDKFPSYEMYMKIDNFISTPAPVGLLQFNAVPPVTNIIGAPDTPINAGVINF
jgi:hypothetical protein